LYFVFYTLTNTEPQIYLNKDNTFTNDTIPEIIVSSKKTSSSKKAELYKIYLSYCNEIVKDTILQTGYLKFDTLSVSSIPADKIYLGKPIIKSVQISNDLANIVLADTIWNLLEAPEYRSSYDYYVLAKHPVPIRKIVYFDYSDKIIVKRPKVYTFKRSKPLLFNDWDKYINNKSYRTSTIEQFF
jgi:hypothetical protein